MSQRAPVTDWPTDWDHLDPRWVEDPVSDLGRDPRARVPDRPHRPLQGRLSADPLRGHARHRLRLRALLLAAVVVRDNPPPSRAAARRPSPPTPRATGRRAWCCCRLSRRRPSTSWSPGARGLQRADRRFLARGVRRGRRLRAAHSRARHRPHARRPREDGDLPQVDPRVLEQGTTDAVRRSAASGEMTDTSCGKWRARRRSRATTCQLPAGRQVSGRPPLTREHIGLAAPAADRRHRHDLERHRRLPLAPGQAPGTAGASSRSRR